LPLPGIEPRSPGHPARSQTLYCLSYPGSWGSVRIQNFMVSRWLVKVLHLPQKFDRRPFKIMASRSIQCYDLYWISYKSTIIDSIVYMGETPIRNGDLISLLIFLWEGLTDRQFCCRNKLNFLVRFRNIFGPKLEQWDSLLDHILVDCMTSPISTVTGLAVHVSYEVNRILIGSIFASCLFVFCTRTVLQLPSLFDFLNRGWCSFALYLIWTCLRVYLLITIFLRTVRILSEWHFEREQSW
jgi:hypothetical protein